MTTIDKISHMLKLQNKTQRSLADYLGIHANMITRWKDDSCRSYNRYLPEIADFFGITIDELVRDKSPQKTNEYMPVIVKAKNHGVTADELSIALNFTIAIKKKKGKIMSVTAYTTRSVGVCIDDLSIDDERRCYNDQFNLKRRSGRDFHESRSKFILYI